MRLLICAGGTGGGVYPALAVHSALKVIHPELETLWVGGEGGMEARLVERASLPFKTIPAAGLHGVAWRQLPGNLKTLARGYFAAQKILAEFKPDVLFFTGGYLAVPMALAGRKIPSLLYVPDLEPGLALKALSYFATRITLTAEESRQFFPKRSNLIVTGYPTRRELGNWKKVVARKRFGLKSDLPVLLVFGGSKGARSINQAVLEQLPALLEQVEILHISGELDWPQVEVASETLSKEQAKRYHAYPYLHEDMGAALAAADFSHKLHVALKPDCTACHAAARPRRGLHTWRISALWAAGRAGSVSLCLALPKSECRNAHQTRCSPDDGRCPLEKRPVADA